MRRSPSTMVFSRAGRSVSQNPDVFLRWIKAIRDHSGRPEFPIFFPAYLESFETVSLNSSSELNNLDSLGSGDIDYEKRPAFEDLNNQLLVSLYEEPALDTQEQVKVSI